MTGHETSGDGPPRSAKELAPGGYPIDPSLERRWGIAENGDSYEVAVRPHLIDELRRRWPPLGLERRSTPGGPVQARIGLSDRWVVVPDAEGAGNNPPLVAWDLLERSLAVFAAHRLSRLVAVHAAVIGWHGRALVVPAVSGGGKSTLSLAAHQVGASVMSDEYALIDPETGFVTGWHRPVRILTDDGGVDRHDIAFASDPLPVGCIAFVAHEGGSANAWSEVSRGVEVGRLIAHTTCAAARPTDSLEAALFAVRSAYAVEGTWADAAVSVEPLLAVTAER